MNKEQVIKQIGQENWEEFEEWLEGQTVSINEDGTEDYYSWDVLRFIGYITG